MKELKERVKEGAAKLAAKEAKKKEAIESNKGKKLTVEQRVDRIEQHLFGG